MIIITKKICWAVMFLLMVVPILAQTELVVVPAGAAPDEAMGLAAIILLCMIEAIVFVVIGYTIYAAFIKPHLTNSEEDDDYDRVPILGHHHSRTPYERHVESAERTSNTYVPSVSAPVSTPTPVKSGRLDADYFY